MRRGPQPAKARSARYRRAASRREHDVAARAAELSGPVRAYTDQSRIRERQEAPPASGRPLDEAASLAATCAVRLEWAGRPELAGLARDLLHRIEAGDGGDTTS